MPTPWTAVLVTVAAYFMLGLEQVANDFEDPFGSDPDDLQMDDLCEVMERSVRQVLEPVTRR